MEERIKRQFLICVKVLMGNGENDDRSDLKKAFDAHALTMITALYSNICGISYDEAANELHQASYNTGEEKSRR